MVVRHHDQSTLGFELDGHLTWLHRYCARKSGAPHIAEDLAQETLVEAWRNRHKLGERVNERSWLAAIATNVCLRWRRSASRGPWLELALADESEGFDALDQHLARGDEDPVWVSEQQELRVLVERAMAHLPDSSRRLLAERYELDLTMAELAQRRDVNPATVAVQLQRARARLKAILLESFPDEAASFAPGCRPATEEWHRTRLWCPCCGSERLRARLEPLVGDFILQCPRCATDPGSFIYSWQERDTGGAGVLRPVRSAPQALDRTLKAGPRFLAVERDEQRPCCPYCGGQTTPKLFPIQSQHEDQLRPEDTSLEVWCHRCGYLSASATFAGLAIFSPHGMEFWRQHGRVAIHDVRRTVVGEVDAVAVTLKSVASSDAYTSVFSADEALVLRVE
jgi:RNA polymerase sigma factor (sigma-70 family)